MVVASIGFSKSHVLLWGVARKKNIPETEAVKELVGLICENGDWKDPAEGQ